MNNNFIILFQSIGNFSNLLGWTLTIFAVPVFIVLLIVYFVAKDFKYRYVIKYILWTCLVGPLLLLIGLLSLFFASFESLQSESPTSQLTPPTELAEWRTYEDKIAGFSVRYPETWDYKVLNDTTVYSDDEPKMYFGKVMFRGPEGLITLVFGDGFGGAYCGFEDGYLANGTMDTFTADGSEINLCKVSSSELDIRSTYSYTWVGSCGNCSVLERTYNGGESSYAIDIESDSENLKNTPISQIISSLDFK